MNIQKNDEELFSLGSVFLEKVPFHHILGLHFCHTEQHPWAVRLDKKPELIGNYLTGILHGGVIAAVLDSVGGLAVFMALLEKLGDVPIEQKKAMLMKMATIDMRIDYLRPAKGDFFIATAHALKCGKRVSSTRMELHDNQDKLIAVGSAAFLHML